MKIIVSIPVHEKPEVIKNQIQNFKKYIDNLYIVLHVSKGFLEQYDIKEIDNIEGVYINPVHLDTKWADIIHTHISNFHFISKIMDFDYYVMHASNDMYIKHGFSNYIQKFDAGFNVRKVIKKDSHWWPGNMAINDSALKNMMADCGQTMIIASQIESSFYKKGIMEEIVSIIEKYYPVAEKDNAYSREEVYFSTIASNIVSWDRIGFPTTFSEVHRFDRTLWKIREVTRFIYQKSPLLILIPQRYYDRSEVIYNNVLFKSKFYKTTRGTIKRLLRNDKKYINKNSFLNDGSGQFRLYENEVFSVKRVERDILDPVRIFISQSI